MLQVVTKDVLWSIEILFIDMKPHTPESELKPVYTKLAKFPNFKFRMSFGTFISLSTRYKLPCFPFYNNLFFLLYSVLSAKSFVHIDDWLLVPAIYQKEY